VAGDGFALGIFNSAGEMRAFFDILETASSVKFLSAPQIMVVDNQTATFRVGDQIPVVTRSSQSTADPNAPIVAEVQYRDTGTLLKVTPRINDGGMVTLEVSQEVSTPGATPAVGGAGNVAISQRTIESTVIVHNGQTIVLGGLFRENTSNSKGGIPGLMEIPVVGNLFSNTTRDINRTELIITLTPKVVRNPREAQEISQELRERISEAAMFMDETNQRRAAGAAAGMAVRAHE
jgi:general secretion pathway protein D